MRANDLQAADRILRLPEAVKLSGVKRATIYRYMSKGTFPQSVQIGVHCVGWLQSDKDLDG